MQYKHIQCTKQISFSGGTLKLHLIFVGEKKKKAATVEMQGVKSWGKTGKIYYLSALAHK